MATRKTSVLPEVNFSDWGDIRYLHLGTEWVQGSMKLDAPFEIELEYVQRMMAWLLFVDGKGVANRHAMQLGLGAATLTKFCRKALRMRTTAVELNQTVIDACRLWFHLPADTARLKVLAMNAADFAADPQRRDSIDVLCVDLYDHAAASPVLDSEDFYRDCHALLAEGGVLSVNLFGRDASFERSAQRIADVFGAAQIASLRPTREGNTVVVALKVTPWPDREALAARADNIEARFQLPARKWLRMIRPWVAKQ